MDSNKSSEDALKTEITHIKKKLADVEELLENPPAGESGSDPLLEKLKEEEK